MTTKIVLDMPSAEYHADPFGPSLSASIARILISESPRHAWLAHPKLGGKGRKATRRMDRGSMLHDLCLGGQLDVHVMTATYDVKHKTKAGELVTDFRTKAAQDERDAAGEAGKVVMFEHQASSLKVFANDVVESLGDRGIYCADPEAVCNEMSCFFETEGIQCKARIDNWNPCMITDLKFLESANPKKLASVIYNFGYDIEMAAHIEAVETCRPELAGRVTAQLACVESAGLITIVPISGEWLELGRARWGTAKAIWKECLSRNRWPGYESGATVLPTPWMLTALDEENGALEFQDMPPAAPIETSTKEELEAYDQIF